jgi:hypothetical protein
MAVCVWCVGAESWEYVTSLWDYTIMFPSVQRKSLIHEITMLHQLHIFTHMINIMA